MSLESASWINQLVATNPEGTDPKSQGDDHLRMLKAVLRNQFPAFVGAPVTKTEAQINAGLIAGSYGLGGSALGIQESAINTADLATGFYLVQAQALGVLPVNVDGYLLHIDHPAPNYATRQFSRLDTIETWRQYKAGAGWSQWIKEWDSANNPRQSTLTDISSIAQLSPQSFGVGVPMPAGANPDLNWPPFAKTVHNSHWAGIGWENMPAGQSGYIAVVEWAAYSPDWGMQTFKNPALGQTWERYWHSATTWTPWVLRSAVSSNLIAGNGYSVANGLVEQWGNAASIADDATAVIAFPLAMTECFTVVANPSRWVAGTEFNCLSVISFTGANFTCGFSSNGTGVNSGAVRWMAKGRL